MTSTVIPLVRPITNRIRNTSRARIKRTSCLKFFQHDDALHAAFTIACLSLFGNSRKVYGHEYRQLTTGPRGPCAISVETTSSVSTAVCTHSVNTGTTRVHHAAPGVAVGEQRQQNDTCHPASAAALAHSRARATTFYCFSLFTVYGCSTLHLQYTAHARPRAEYLRDTVAVARQQRRGSRRLRGHARMGLRGPCVKSRKIMKNHQKTVNAVKSVTHCVKMPKR